jgi:cytochrome c553
MPAIRHRRAPIMLAIAALSLECWLPAGAADVAAGRRKALQCQACHGLDGLSKVPAAPHLAGQPEPYLIKAINEFRRGVRKHEMMTIAVQPLTDQDVADLAAYYAAIEIAVKPAR